MENQNTNEPIDVTRQSTQDESPVRPAVRSGVMLAGISILLLLVIYLINGALFANMWVGLTIMLFSLVLVVVFGINYRKQIGGFISFKNAYVFSLVLLIVAGFISQIFNYILFNFIDPDLVNIVTDAAVENTESLMERFNAPQSDIDEALERTEKQMANQYTIGGIAKGFGIGILIYLFISLITGAIIKKKNPEESI